MPPGNLFQAAIDFLAWQPTSIQYHTGDFPDVGEVFERVGFEQNQVRLHAFGDFSKFVLLCKKDGRVHGSRSQDFVRRQTRLMHEFHFGMDGKSGNVEKLGGVRAEKKARALLMKRTDQIEANLDK